MVTLGAQHAVALAARTLLRRGERALVESPTYHHAYEALRQGGARLVATPVTTDGWDADRLRDTMERTRPSLAYLVPEFHNPTGTSMPPLLREQVVDQARRTGTTLIIDETTADLDIDRPWDDGPFAVHAPPGTGVTILTVGSLGKSGWGGLRIGWVRADAEVVRRFVAARAGGDLGTPQLAQLVAAEAIGVLPELLARRSQQLRERRDHLVAELRSRLPQWQLPSVDGGLTRWVGPGAAVSSTLALACQARSLRITAGPRFGIDGAYERFLRVPFTADVEQLDRAVQILQDTWHALPVLAPAPSDLHLPTVV